MGKNDRQALSNAIEEMKLKSATLNARIIRIKTIWDKKYPKPLICELYEQQKPKKPVNFAPHLGLNKGHSH